MPGGKPNEDQRDAEKRRREMKWLHQFLFELGRSVEIGEEHRCLGGITESSPRWRNWMRPGCRR